MKIHGVLNLFLIFLVLLAVGACGPTDKSPSEPARRSPIEAHQGTMDGGGGDFISDPDATVSDVIAAIQTAQIVAPMVLRYFATVRAGQRVNNRVWSKETWDNYDVVFGALFSEKSDIFDYFEQLEWEVLEEKACKDKFDRDKAGSAYPYKENRICLSASEIAKVSKKVNLVRRITALILHELIHKRGIESEEVAQDFEKWLNQTLPEDPVQYLSNSLDRLHPLIYAHSADFLLAINPDVRGEYDSKFPSVTSYSRQILELLSKKLALINSVEFCDLLLEVQATAFALSRDSKSTVPLEFFTVDDFNSIERIRESALPLNSYCIKGKTSPNLVPEQVYGQVAEIYINGRYLSESLDSIDPIFKSDAVHRNELKAQ